MICISLEKGKEIKTLEKSNLSIAVPSREGDHSHRASSILNLDSEDEERLCKDLDGKSLKESGEPQKNAISGGIPKEYEIVVNCVNDPTKAKKDGS